jgi:mRNA-degrading endonuclease HigB of HigAB toxin-antitoxin module
MRDVSWDANWTSPAEVVKAYANASFVGPDRVVFNIKGNQLIRTPERKIAYLAG